MKTLKLLFLSLSFLNISQAQLPFWEIQSDALANYDFNAVNVNISGDYAVLSGYRYENEIGAAAVFQLINEEWVEVDLLQASDGQPGDRFGLGCVIDGDYMVISAPTDNFATNLPSKAYFFKLDNGFWLETQIVEPDLSIGSAFGLVADIEGEYAIIGAPDNSAGNGAAVIYKRTDEVWNEEIILYPPDSYNAYNFGAGASISGDWAAVGSYLFGSSGSGFTNAVFLYQLIDDEWTFQQALVHTESSNVAITPSWNVAHTDGDLLFGYRHPSDGINDIVGGAKFFQLEGDEWGPIQTVMDPDLEDNQFGRHVAMEGQFAITGYSDQPPLNSDSLHQVMVYLKSDPANWTEIGRLRLESGSVLNFQGPAVDVSEEFAIIGDPDANFGTGKAYILDLREFVISGTSSIAAFAECKLFPNPASDVLMVTSETPIQQIILFDESGRTLIMRDVEHQMQLELDLTIYPAGQYFAQILFETGKGEVHSIMVHR